MASGRRIAARLERLTHAQLVELCALTCTLDVHDSRRAVDAALTMHEPLTNRLVDEVLLSSDLGPRLLGSLDPQNGCAAAVCRTWRDCWEATRKLRRKLHPAPLATPDFAMGEAALCGLAALPEERLCIATYNRLHIVDKGMNRLQTVGADEGGVSFGDISSLAAGTDGLYVSEIGLAQVRRLSPDGFEVLAAHSDEQYDGFLALALAPGRLLFVAADLHVGDDQMVNEVMTLDPLTLQRRHTFGRALFPHDNLRGMAVAGQELIVGDAHRRCLHAFSFSGEHLREMRGDWGLPRSLCFVEDRLYLIEYQGLFSAEESDGRENNEQLEGSGRRIFVLTPEGSTLQVYSPDEGSFPAVALSLIQYSFLCHFDGRLVMHWSAAGVADDHFFALRGI